MKRYSITQARDRLNRIIREVEAGEVVEIERRGAAVAVVLSWERWQMLSATRPGFFEALERLRSEFDLHEQGIERDVWEGVRDPSPGRDVDL